MTPADNILYFNDDIDIRICLKNGYTTLRTAWLSCHHMEYYTGRSESHVPISAPARYELAMKYQDIWDQPFRRGSYRIAVKRDPIQRFISTVSYLNNVKLEPRYTEDKKPYIDLTNVNKDDIDSVLDAFDNQTLKDEHFFSQSYFMGQPNDYDKVYDITEMDELLSWMTRKCKPKKPIEQLWKNKTKDTSARIELTDKQKMRVIKLYAKDYANGWY